jgi:chromosome segregation ATPase
VTPRARLRTIAQLRRTRGVGGDMRYVLTVIFGLRRARRELGVLEAKEATLHQSRRRHLTTLGRNATTAERFDHPALGHAREQLGKVEEERAGHTAQVAAADGELQRVNRDRAAKAKQHAADLEGIDAEIAELQKKLDPLEKELAGVTRRAAALRDSLRRIDEKIAFTEARLSGADIQEADRGAIQAEIASLKADRKSLQQDEPVLASSLDSLQPRIAKLEAARLDARRRRLEAEQAERDDQRRTEELLAAIGAKRKVLDRAASDAEALRDKILFELGERIYVERPESMAPELSPVDAIDVELGTVDRRTMELREMVQSVDRWKVVRGTGLWILLLAVIGMITALALGFRPF